MGWWSGIGRRRRALEGVGLAVRVDRDADAPGVPRYALGLDGLRADVVDEQRSLHLALAVGEPGVLRQPHGLLVHVIDDLIRMAARQHALALLLELGRLAR